jgi:antitoxin CptB
MIDRVALSRLKWHSRRGMLENDLVLSAFFERHESEIDATLADGLAALLDLADGDLWDLIAGRCELGPAAGAAVRSVLQKLRDCTAPAIH